MFQKQQLQLVNNPAHIFYGFGLTTKAFAAGMSECGKSTIGRFVQKLYKREVVIDTLNEYTNEPRVSGLLNFVDAIKKVKDQHEFRIVYSFPLSNSDKKEQFEKICEIIFYLGNVHLNIEEVHHYCSPTDIGYWFSLLNTGGRHQNVSIYSSSQRFAKVHSDVIAQAHHKFVGQLDSHRDFHAAAEYFTDSDVRALTRYNFLHKYNNEFSAFNTKILI